MEYYFQLKVFEEEDISEFANLSKQYYISSNPVTNKNVIKWKHINSPYGKSLQHSMKIGKKCHGRIMFTKNIAFMNKKKVFTINPCDLLIDKKHRKNPKHFIKLVTEPKNFLKKNLVIHTSNEITNNLYEKLLKFNKPFNLDLYFFPLNIFKILLKYFDLNPKKNYNFIFKFFLNIYFATTKKLSDFYKIEVKNGVPNNAEIDLLKKKMINDHIPFFDRSNDFFEWRVFRYKKENLVKLKVYKNKKILGYIILLNISYKKFKIKLIFDFMLANELSFLEKQFISATIFKSGLNENCDLVAVLKNSKSSTLKNFDIFPFVKIPNRFLKHNSSFFVRSLNYKVEDYKNFHVTFADLDYF